MPSESDPRRAKWQRRHLATRDEPRAARALRELDYLLPGHGRALDLACGRGGNALLMAQRGLEVSAWDYAPAAIDDLRRRAGERGLSIRAGVRDVLAEPPAPAQFDVIVVSYFLQRELAPAIAAALRPGGLLFYETWSGEQVDERGPANPAFRLGPNELLRLFADLEVVDYREHGRVGERGRGWGDIAALVARQG